jgi:acetyl esterase/lipase
MSRHYPSDALSTNPYFSPAVAGTFGTLVHAQRSSGLRIFIQHGTAELITPDQKLLIEKMRREGVDMEVDTINGGAHLDAGIAFALLERGPESSWVRLLEAVKRYAS